MFQYSRSPIDYFSIFLSIRTNNNIFQEVCYNFNTFLIRVNAVASLFILLWNYVLSLSTPYWSYKSPESLAGPFISPAWLQLIRSLF